MRVSVSLNKQNTVIRPQHGCWENTGGYDSRRTKADCLYEFLLFPTFHYEKDQLMTLSDDVTVMT